MPIFRVAIGIVAAVASGASVTRTAQDKAVPTLKRLGESTSNDGQQQDEFTGSLVHGPSFQKNAAMMSLQPRRKLVFGSLWGFLIGVLDWFLNFFGLGGIDDDDDDGTIGFGSHPDNQFTPNVADWSTFYDKVAESSSAVDHSPDGVLWLQESDWPRWDGNVIDPTTMTEAEFHSTICPTQDSILGLREIYYNNGPQGGPFFKDPLYPTKEEVDAWHAASLTHLRRLVGIDHPAKPDHCLFARALWGQEVKFTDKWDAKYGDVCPPESGPHCGSTFMLDAEDQIPYLPDSGIVGTCPRLSGSEGVSSAAKSNIPWSVKWVRVFCSFLSNEGYNGGHVGPFFRREKFGWSFLDLDPLNNNNNAIFRGKWAGTLITTPWTERRPFVELVMTD